MLIYHSLPMLHWRSSSSTFKSIFGCFKGVKSAKKSKKSMVHMLLKVMGSTF